MVYEVPWKLSVFANPFFQTIIDKVEQPTVTVIVGTTLIMNDQAPDDAIDQIDLLSDDDFEGFQNMRLVGWDSDLSFA